MSIYEKLYEFKEKEIKLVRNTKAFNYSYATLSQIQAKLAPILKELKLVVVHYNKDDKVFTQIRDIEDDSFVESCLEIWKVESKTVIKQKFDKQKNNKNIEYEEEKETTEYNEKDPQWVWSIVTYYRRYNLLALLDLETEDDDWQTWSPRYKSKKSYVDNEKKEKHTCKKCKSIVEVNPFMWKFWMCFRCPECNEFSGLNPVFDWGDLSKQEF